MLAFFVIVFLAVYLDQITKWLAIIFLKGEESAIVIKDVLRFTYVENRGAAFGMLAEHRWVFLLISSAAIIGITVYMIKYRPESKLACTAISFIVGGGIGNMIDRLCIGYVVDFIDFYAFPNLWKFIFNVADSFVCVGAGLLMFYLISSMIKEAKLEKLNASEGKTKDTE
jgi:signal peptidase II